MCLKPESFQHHHNLCLNFGYHQKLTKGNRLQIHRLINRRRRSSKEKEIAGVKAQMRFKNIKLYIENKNIIEENEKLRKKALLLHQENQALLSQLQKKFSQKLDK